MRRSISIASCAVVPIFIGALVSSRADAQTPLSPTWVHTESGYTTDGIAVGDVHSTAGLELVVVSEGSTWYQSPVTYGTGRVLVLGTGGTVLSRFDAPSMRELMGLPLIEQLDAGSLEYLVGEFRSATGGGGVYAVPGDATAATSATWILSPRGWPGLYNMGPSAGHLISTSGGHELVVPGWDGLVQVVRRSDGVPLATYDVWTQHGQSIYGHVAIGNVDNVTGEEIVLVGKGGTVLALTPQTDGSMTVAYESVPDGSYAYGSGPAIADIDGDGYPEIIVALTGVPVVRAYDAIHSLSGDCEYEWAAPSGGNYYWTSPVVGDVDGDGFVEVVVEATNSTVSVLSTEGIVSSPTACTPGNYDVAGHVVGAGGRSWFTPALADVTGDSAPDIIAASFTTLEVLDVSAAGGVTVAYQATDSTATFYPSAAVVAGLDGVRAAIFVSGWRNGNVYRYDIPEAGTTAQSWSTPMGSNKRTGFCCADPSCASCSGGSCAQTCTEGGSCSCDQPGCDCQLTCDAKNCDPVCSGGATCDIQCSDTKNCSPSCINVSTCNITCDQLNNCNDIVCSDNSSCSVTCENANECEMACTLNSICAMDCHLTNNCAITECSGGSDCQLACNDVNGCDISCADDSTCLLTCADVNSCQFSACQTQTSCGSGVIACNRPCP